MATYAIRGSAAQDSANVLTWCAWVEKDGEIETGATACTVTLYQLGNGTETAVDGATGTDTNPSDRGVFCGQITTELTPGDLYYLYVAATSDAASREGAIPIFVPVRVG